MEKNGIERTKSLIDRVIRELALDLTDKAVLTEVGSGLFLVTPLIALRANARKVYAWVRDSSYGKAEDIMRSCKELVNEFQLPDNIEYGINQRPAHHISSADIITNLGFVRPLNSEFLDQVSEHSVIAGMCEAWELRPADIDLHYCKQKNIKVAGTWENHPDLKIFDGCGNLAVKMALEAGYEVYQNNIIIWSNDHFGKVVENGFKNFGANKIIRTTDPGTLYKNIKDIDFLFFCDYNESRQIIGHNGFISIDEIQKLNKGVGIVHLYGDLDNNYIKEKNLNVFPDKKGRASVMTYTLAHLGPKLIINLHAAGLKVGQCLIDGNENELVQIV